VSVVSLDMLSRLITYCNRTKYERVTEVSGEKSLCVPHPMRSALFDRLGSLATRYVNIYDDMVFTLSSPKVRVSVFVAVVLGPCLGLSSLMLHCSLY
jgi:hypothetical protein